MRGLKRTNPLDLKVNQYLILLEMTADQTVCRDITTAYMTTESHRI